MELEALKEWKPNMLRIVNGSISYYCQNNNSLPPKPKKALRHFKLDIQEFCRKYDPADKAANNIVFV